MILPAFAGCWVRILERRDEVSRYGGVKLKRVEGGISVVFILTRRAR